MTTYPAKYEHLAVYIHAEAESEPIHVQPWRLVGCLAVALSAGLVIGALFIVVAKFLGGI